MARPSQDPQIRITEILDTAENLFTIKGYYGTTISDIAKEMGVTQGMFYYYFKSKEEILEALLNRQVSYFVTEIKAMTSSNSLTPPEKIGLMLSIALKGIYSKKTSLLNTIYDERNLLIKDKIARQTKLLLTPLGLKIIEEGKLTKNFNTPTPQTSLNYILIIMDFLVETLYETVSNEILNQRLRMAEILIEKALDITKGTIRISI